MRLLTKEKITRINHSQVQIFGGNFLPPNNYLHEENLDYLVEIIDSSAFGVPLYPELFQKASIYIFNIISNHIFQDGNKRTGLHSALIFLEMNGYRIQASDDELIEFATDIATGKMDLLTVQSWIKSRLVPYPS